MWAEVYHEPPTDPATAERLFAAPIHYACTRLGIVAPRSWLELPIEHADNRLLRVLRRLLPRNPGAARGNRRSLCQARALAADPPAIRQLRDSGGSARAGHEPTNARPPTAGARHEPLLPSRATFAVVLRSAISTTGASGCHRSRICSATRSRARSTTRSAAGPAGRRRRIAGLPQHPAPSVWEG